MRIIVVDDQDRQISIKDYLELTAEDIYRVSALWMTDKNTGECLLTQRKMTMTHDPGKWMSAAAGTVEEGETYRYNMLKEAEEEIGLRNLELTQGPKQFVDGSSHRYFVQWFLGEVDKDEVEIRIQEDEVEAYAWIRVSDLTGDVSKNPEKYVPSMGRALSALRVG